MIATRCQTRFQMRVQHDRNMIVTRFHGGLVMVWPVLDVRSRSLEAPLNQRRLAACKRRYWRCLQVPILGALASAPNIGRLQAPPMFIIIIVSAARKRL